MEKTFSQEEQRIRDRAWEFAKANRKNIAKEFTDESKFPSERDPVSVFMAGSPGAGKTEASKALIKRFSSGASLVMRIDPDEFREKLPGYNGSNSWLFQSATIKIVEKVVDQAMSKQQSFLLDGTLSSWPVAERNIKRSLDKGRYVLILYVYQKPDLAWRFVQAREKREGRRILPETFIEQYFGARQVVNHLKQQFGKSIQVDLLQKNIGGPEVFKENVSQIDSYIPEKYSHADLERILASIPDL